jgi:anti-sigma regulatory factor (Ser/Thr protein kinase)
VGGHLNQLRLPPENPSAAAARRFVAAELAAEPQEVRDTATLLASELVTNAILHANTELEVSVTRSSGGLRIEVADDSENSPVVRQYSLEAATGRGLRLVEQVASSWGFERRGTGKAVWFELGAGRDGETESHGAPAVGLSPPDQDRSPGAEPIQRDEEGENPRDDLAHFSLLGLPLEVLSRISEHYDGLFREFRLIADLDRGRPEASVPTRLTQLIDDLGTRFSGFTRAQEELILQATAQGLGTIDLEYRLPIDAVPEIARLDALLDEADTYCAAGTELLTLAPSDETVAFRKWLLGEFVLQATGEAPLAWSDGAWARGARGALRVGREPSS